jgi:hypothetical protein
MARGAILSVTKSIGSIPSFSPFDKGGWGDFEIDFLGSPPAAAAIPEEAGIRGHDRCGTGPKDS